MGEATSTVANQYIPAIYASGGAQVVAGTVYGDVIFGNAGSRNEEVTQNCRNALFLTDPAIDRARLVSAKGFRVAGTCEWIRENGTYVDWLRGNTKLLWIRGGPGKGKTMLSIFLTEELESIARKDDGLEVLYYFCSSGDGNHNTVLSVLRGLLWQLVQKRPELGKHLLQHFDTPEKAQMSLNSPETLWATFLKLVAEWKGANLFYVIDGLDECDEASQRWVVTTLVHFMLEQPADWYEGTLRIVILGRDIPLLRASDISMIKLEPDNDNHINDDIKKFVSSGVERLARMISFDHNFRRTIEQILLDRSDGTFLWVGFAMAELLTKRTSVEIERTLASLPKGLPAIYGRVLHQIEPEFRAICSAVLRWVTMSHRPLFLNELASALKTQRTALLAVEQVIRDHVVMCGTLLSTVDEKVRLIHQSVRDYLTRSDPDLDVVLEQFRIDPDETNLQIALTCLDLIEQGVPQVSPSIKTPEMLGAVSWPERLTLMHYALQYWLHHATSTFTVAETLLKYPGSFFNKKSEIRDIWWLWYMRKDSRVSGVVLPPLHMACFLGNMPWALLLLKNERLKPRSYKLAPKTDSKGRIALHYAASNGFGDTIQLLLDRGSGIDSTDQDGMTALCFAAVSNREAVIRLLLNRGADSTIKDRNGSSVLSNAAWWGCTGAVREFLDRGMALDAKNNNGLTALHEAAGGVGLNGVLEFLLTRGADVNVKDFQGRPAMFEACMLDSLSAVATLLDWGADVDSKDSIDESPLHWARSVDVGRLLLERGADINAKNRWGWRPLHFAAWATNDNAALVQYLLENGADVYAEDNDQQTAYDLAISSRNPEVARLLRSAMGVGECPGL